MDRRKPEPMHVVKQRRDGVLGALIDGVPYIQFLGISFERRGDELTGVLHFDEKLIGNPILPALHGGVTAAFLEVTSIITLSWEHLWPLVEAGELSPEEMVRDRMPRLPKTIGFTVDYLRSGLPREAYARATINRAGRRYASVRAEAWQDNRNKLFAEASGRFLMPRPGA